MVYINFYRSFNHKTKTLLTEQIFLDSIPIEKPPASILPLLRPFSSPHVSLFRSFKKPLCKLIMSLQESPLGANNQRLQLSADIPKIRITFGWRKWDGNWFKAKIKFCPPQGTHKFPSKNSKDSIHACKCPSNSSVQILHVFGS